MELKQIAVFCGSSAGTKAIYREQAYLLGQTLAGQGIGLVYGGANVGLMKEVADGALDCGGEVTGVLPRFLMDRELAHKKLTRIIEVETMHERKYRMSELCDGAIALPGGYGTLDEFFEMITWRQLKLHHKPVALLNINGYYDPILQQIDLMHREGFLKESYKQLLLCSDNISGLLEQMRHASA